MSEKSCDYYALAQNTQLNPEDVVRKAMTIAGDICVYTNHSVRLEKLENNAGSK